MNPRPKLDDMNSPGARVFKVLLRYCCGSSQEKTAGPCALVPKHERPTVYLVHQRQTDALLIPEWGKRDDTSLPHV